MKKSRKFKFLVIALVFIMFSMCFVSKVNADLVVDDVILNVYKESKSKYQFNQRELLTLYAGKQTGDENLKYPNTYDVTAEMIEDKTAIPLTGFGFDDGKIDALDSACVTSTLRAYKNTNESVIESILSTLATTLGYEKNDIEIRTTAYKPTESNNIIFSTRTTTKEEFDKIIHSVRGEMEEELINQYPDVNRDTIKEVINNEIAEKILPGEYAARRLLRLDAIMPDGVKYTLVLDGKSKVIDGEENFSYNWYMVKTEDEVKEFKTDITYTAIVDGKNVDGTKVDETFFPNYDRSKVEKDANVTANIVSTTKNDIVKINGVDLNPDGTKNELGWYYSNKEDKTVISKDYPFDTFDNTTDNGIVVEKDLELTSSDGLKDKETVSIEWPFRIIDVKQEPGEITEETEKVIVTITTNLPMEEEKLPEGWAFTTDEEGKTQHRIFKEFLKENGDKKEDVIVTANDRDDTDSTQVEVKWPAKPQTPEKLPDTGSSYVLIGVVVALVGCSAIIYRKIRK